MELKDQIRIAREAKGWEREELATLMGVSKTSVKLWEETGRIKLGNIEKLEGVLGVKLNATGQTPQGMPPFVTPEGLQLLEAIEQLPIHLKDAIRTLVMDGLRPTKKRIEPFIESLGTATSEVQPFLIDDISVLDGSGQEAREVRRAGGGKRKSS